MKATSYKGNNGKVGVLGGSIEYTGAPYYAANAALRTGSDLSHIFCPEESAIFPIKSYSPELIVHPASIPQDTIKWFNGAINSLVIGPGLGRNKKLENYLEFVLKDLEKKEI